MRIVPVILACGCAAAATACASRPDPEASVMDRSRGAAASAMGQTYRGVGEAASTPLRDLNLMKKEIPVVLLAAMDSPYQTRTASDCPTIAQEVAALDLVLGPDVDVPDEERQRDYYRLGAEEAADAALDAVRDAAEGMVPVRSWVRRLTGAQQHDKKIKEAIYAGSVRRAFLKGMGDQRGCMHPAAPLSSAHRAPTSRAPAAADAGQSASAAAPGA